MGRVLNAKALFGLEAWVDALADTKVVSLSSIIRELTRLAESEEASINQLATVITRDPALTSKVIRVANSVLYNPGRQAMSTVSRAIMHVGFNTVRAICISAIVMESVIDKAPREGMLKQMATSFHAAVQARGLCERVRADVKEEIFVASLMVHLGKLLVWSYRHPVADQAYKLELQGAPARDVEALLGTTYERLTLEICKQWNLGDTLNQVLVAPKAEQDRRAQAVRLGEAITRALARGWDSEEMRQVLVEVAAFLSIKESEARRRIEQNYKGAATLSESYNDPRITQLIQKAVKVTPAGESAGSHAILEPNPQLQLEVLQQIMVMMTQGVDSARLFQLVLNGLHQGVGLERVALLLLNQPRTQVAAKFLAGAQTATWKERFLGDYERTARNFFAQIMSGREGVLVQDGQPAALSRLWPDHLVNLTHTRNFIIGPLSANGREVGFLYADLGVSGRHLGDAHVSGFKHFLQQTTLCLGIAAARQK